MLRPTARSQPNQVVMTVVEPRPMFIRAQRRARGELHGSGPGEGRGHADRPIPDLKLPATLDDMSDVPVAPGSFDAVVRRAEEGAKLLMPGMTCKVKLVPYLKKDAIDRAAEGGLHRRIGRREALGLGAGQGRQAAERDVTVGEKTDKQVEILKGLSEGEKVVAERRRQGIAGRGARYVNDWQMTRGKLSYASSRDSQHGVMLKHKLRAWVLGGCKCVGVADRGGLLLPAGLGGRGAGAAAAAAERGRSPSRWSRPAAEIEKSIGRGIEFLLKRQNKDGSWGSANITRPSDVMRRCRGPIRRSGGRDGAVHFGPDRDRRQRPGSDRGARSGRSLAVRESAPASAAPRPTRSTTPGPTPTGSRPWCACSAAGPTMPTAAAHPRADRAQIGMLERYEVVDGGWAYYDFNAHTQKPSGSTMSFVTAAVLVALHEAKQAGVDTPERLVERATASIRRQRKPDFSSSTAST